MSQQAIQVKDLMPGRTDRALFVGMTGSGKTTLVEYLLRYREYVVILDVKGMIKWKGYQVHKSMMSLIKSKHKRLLYKPNIHEAEPDRLEEFFLWSYERLNHTLYVDEAGAITTGGRIPFYYKSILTRGRERKVECWQSSQRPVDVHPTLITESEHGYFFKLKAPQDIGRAEDTFLVDGYQVFSLQKTLFYYANTNSGLVTGPLQLNL